MSNKVETVEEFLARGGKITKCMTYGINKHSSIPKFYNAKNTGINKGGLNNTPKAEGVDPQTLLDAAAGTEDEAAVIAFLESQGYEVK